MKLVLKAKVNPDIKKLHDIKDLGKFEESLSKKSNQELKLMLQALKLVYKQFKEWKDNKKVRMVKEELEKRYSASVEISDEVIPES